MAALPLILGADDLKRVDRRRLGERIQAIGASPRSEQQLAALRFDLATEELRTAWIRPGRPDGRIFVFVSVHRHGIPTKLSILAARKFESFGGAVRQETRDQLDESWPMPGEWNSLQDAVTALELADIAGFHDFAAERLLDVPALLEAAWVGRRRRAWAASGFERMLRDEVGELRDAEYVGSTRCSLSAALLIARLQNHDPALVETLEVDLDSVLRYLDDKRSYFASDEPGTAAVQAGLAHHILIRNIPRPRPPLVTTIMVRAPLTIGAFLTVLLALGLTLRAQTRRTA